jgi:hypothetical protein
MHTWGQGKENVLGPRRLVITVCPREPGVVSIPLRPGGPPERLDAPALVRELRGLVAERSLGDRVSLVEGCAGGCGLPGPNAGVTFHSLPQPGERPDHVALGWKTYVYSLGSLPSLATIVDENLTEDPAA